MEGLDGMTYKISDAFNTIVHGMDALACTLLQIDGAIVHLALRVECLYTYLLSIIANAFWFISNSHWYNSSAGRSSLQIKKAFMKQYL